MSTYKGDLVPGQVLYHKWSTNGANGASITRATNGTVSVYKTDSLTQSVAGITDTEDFDALTGIHHLTIDTAADGTFYSAGADYDVVLSGAVIDGQTVNAALCSFSIANRSALRPTVAGRTLDVSATGEAGLDLANVSDPTNTSLKPFGVLASSTAAAITNTSITLAAGHGVSALASALLLLRDGTNAVGKSRIITYSGAGDVFNVDPAWNAFGEVTPSGTLRYEVVAAPPSPTATLPDVNVASISQDVTAADNLEQMFDGTGYAGGAIKLQVDLTTVDTKLDTLLTSDVVLKKNVAVAVWTFAMKLTDGSPGTGLTVTAAIAKDGGAFAGVTGLVTEIGTGWYKHALSQAEMNADDIALKYTATGASQLNVKLRTQS